MKSIGIIGGGIAGLTLAICLRDAGYEIHIFEKNEAFGEVGAAISVWPNALRVFRQTGQLDEIIAASGEMKDVYLRTHKGKILSRSNPQYELPAVCIHRAELHGILLRNAPAQLHAGHALQAFNTLPDGKIQLQFTNGQSHTVDAVVGADGIHSKVREAVIGDGKPIFRGYNIWRGVVPMDVNQGYASETWGPGKRVGIVPIKDGLYGWWATCNEPYLQNDEPEGTRQKLMRLFGHWHAPIPQMIEHTDHFLKNSLSDRKPTKGWSKGQAVLIGDAAHPTTPNMGQGGCMAIEGAWLLAASIKAHGLTPQAFAAYEAKHFDRTKKVVENSLRMGAIGQWQNGLAIGFRNTLFSMMPASATMKIIDQFFGYDVTQQRF